MDQSTKRIKCAIFMFIVISWIWPVAFQIVYLVISNNEGVISNNEGKRLKWYINGQILLDSEIRVIILFLMFTQRTTKVHTCILDCECTG